MDNTKQTIVLAASILMGFALVAGVILFSNMPVIGQQIEGLADAEGGQVQSVMQGSPKREVDSLRRVYGNPDAETTIVEFSDFECPFCSRLHPTLKRVVDESEGAINWEYRHLPLTTHKDARPAAIAAECVGDLVGNDAFWSFISVLFSNQRGLTPAFLELEAVALGVDVDSYQKCLVSQEVARRVDTDLNVAISYGGSGTPFSVVEFVDGTTKVASGALPYQNWVALFNIKK